MKLLVGLGNPGKEHEKQRHNIGFMAIDRIADDYNLGTFKKKFKGEISTGQIKGHKVALLKPQTFMNNSGQSVLAALKFYDIPVENIIVFYDELDLPFTKLRVKQGGGSGGHNGIKSCDKHLPNKDYWRIRMGIDHPGSKERVTGHVLGNFAKDQMEDLDNVLYALSKNTNFLLDGDMAQFASKYALFFEK